MKSKFYIGIILLALFFLIYEKTNAQAPNWLWAKSIGGTSNDFANSVAIDASGNVYTTGYFTGIVDFDPGAGTFNLGPGGGFISKLDASGNFIWAKPIGASGVSITLDASGNVYATGSFSGTVDFDPDSSAGHIFNLVSAGGTDIFISKLDSSGNFVWARAMGGTANEQGYSISLDDSGNVYTTGDFRGTADFDPGTGTFNLISAGDADIFISKLNSAGDFVWAKGMGGNGTFDDHGSSIALDASGYVYTTGYFSEPADFDPGPGVYNLLSAGYYDIFVSKLDGSGNFVWAKTMGGLSDDKAYSIAIDASGNIYTSGSFIGSADFDPGAGVFNLTSGGCFISKLDSAGNFIWAKAIAGPASASMSLDIAGNIYTTGYFGGTVDFDPGAGIFNLSSTSADVFIFKLDSSGNFLWANRIGGSSIDRGSSIITDVTGKVYVAGIFLSPSLSIGLTTLTNAGSGFDIFIAKLDNIVTGIISPENDNGFSVYPNPSDRKFTLSMANSQLIINNISVLNMLGEEVYKYTSASGTVRQEITIDLVDLPEGIYVLQLKAGENYYPGKIVVE